MTRFTLLLPFALVPLLGFGCTVGPNYQRPDADTGDDWLSTAGDATTRPSRLVEGAPAVVEWWRTFRDTELDDLIDRAARGNLDLQIAATRVREARAQRSVVTGDFYPTLEGAGQYQRTQVSENGVASIVGGNGGSSSAGGPPPGSNGSPAIPGDALGGFGLYQAGFDASWEIDLFGRTRRAAEAATADLQVGIENRRDVLLTLLGEVARNYVELRGAQRQLVIAQDNLDAQQRTLNLTRERAEAGVSNDLDVARAAAQVSTTASELPQFRTQVSRAIHRLGVLLGETPESLTDELGWPAEVPPVPEEVPIGLPADLLRRRPDVRRAERELAAATAQTGVAVADLFPRLDLTGSLGLQSIDAGDLLDGDSTFWSVGPALTIPIFKGGQLRAQVEVQNARQERAVLQYRRTVLEALRETRDALVAYQNEQDRRIHLAEAAKQSRRAVDLASDQYRQGVTDFLNVLDAERNLFAAEDALARSDTAVSASLVAVYKSLGGGWELENTLGQPSVAESSAYDDADVTAPETVR